MGKIPRTTIAVYGVVMLATSLGNMSQTALNVMLIDVVNEYGIAVSVGQWLTTIYMLVLGVSVPLSPFLARRLSDKRFVLLSLALFFAGCVCDATAPSFAVLFTGRVLQAIATGLLMPQLQTLGMMRFPVQHRTFAMGIAGIAMGFAPNIGPTLGGFFLSMWGWRSFFVFLGALPVIFAIVTLALVSDEKPAFPRTRFNLGSFILLGIGFCSLLLCFTNASNNALGNPIVWIPAIVGVAILIAYTRYENRTSHPLLDLAIFKDSRFCVGFIMQILLFMSFMGITLTIPLYIEGLQGGTAADAGIVLLPAAVIALVVNPVAGAAADKFGQQRVLLFSGFMLALGAVLACFFTETTPIWLIAACQSIRAIGISATISPSTAWMLATLDKRVVGDGSSFSVIARQVASSLGTAAMVFIITTLSMTHTGMLPYRAAFAFSAVMAVAMFALVIIKVRDERGSQAK